MNKKILAIILPTLILSACGTSSKIDTDIHDWLDERDYEYENMLDKPSDVVSNIDELQDICDYYAFYKVKNFTITPKDYVYSVEGKEDLKHELNYLYWHSELINGVMGMDAKVKSGKWDFTYTFYHNAHLNAPAMVKKAKDLFFQEKDSINRNKTNFATDDEAKKVCDVATTQQLYFAAEHGYKVNPIPGSPAEHYYQEAKDYLNSILEDNMSEFDTFTTIYDDIAHTVCYNYGALEHMDAKDPDLYPDEECAQYDCFFLEGFFDHKSVVCDGYGKVLALLATMEGIDIVRATGSSDLEYESRSLPGHAYTFVNIEDNWYLSDITWGNVNRIKNFEFINYSYLLTYHHDINPYSSTQWPEIQSSMYQYRSSYDADPLGTKQRFFEDDVLEYDGKQASRIVTSTNYNNFIETLSGYFTNHQTEPCYVDVLITSDEAVNAIVSAFENYYFLNGTFETNSYELTIVNNQYQGWF